MGEKCHGKTGILSRGVVDRVMYHLVCVCLLHLSVIVGMDGLYRCSALTGLGGARSQWLALDLLASNFYYSSDRERGEYVIGTYCLMLFHLSQYLLR